MYTLPNKIRVNKIGFEFQQETLWARVDKYVSIKLRALDKVYMTSFLKETRCLRMVINRFLEPTSAHQECDLDKELGCSLCLSNQEKLASKALPEEDSLKIINLGLVGLEEKLTSFNESPCLICLLGFALDDSVKHTIDTCPNRDVILFQRFSINILVRTIKDQIKSNQLLKAKSCCFTCLLPPRVCARRKEEQETIICLYPDTLYMALGILIANILKNYKKSVRYFHLKDPQIGDLRSKSSLLKYLLEPSQIYTTDSIRLINVINDIRLGSILEMREKEEEEEKEEKKRKDINNKRPRTPSRTIENLIISPNPRDKKVYKY